MKRTATALTSGVLGLLLAVSGPAAAAKTADAPWSGYRLTSGSTASSGWVGARKASNQVVYRIDPSRKKTTTTAFKAGAWQTTTTGTGPRRVSAIDTARAAWIVSKYGSYRYGVQNAAVEVALNELLHGGQWALKGAKTTRRLAQTSQAKKIRTFAGTMLTDSARYAGPYAVTVTPTPSKGTGTVAVTVRVAATRTKAGVAALPVSISYSGITRSGLTTRSDGTASASFPLGGPGVRQVSAVVAKVPEHRLLVRKPTTSGASRIVVAGLKSVRTATAPVVVKANPRLSIRSTTTILTNQTPAGQITVTGSLAGPRTATVGLFGPFSSATAATCTSAQLTNSASVAVTGDGTYALPRLSVPRAGYYIWGAILPADATHESATSCSGTVTARASPALSVAPTGTRYRTGAYIHAQLTASGLPAGYADNATLRLYGPFTSASGVSCSESKLKATQLVPVLGNGTVDGPDLKVTNLGYYLWAADLPASALAQGATTSCTASDAVFQVTW